jgi:acetyl-CoA C-acetyltransferase
MTQAYIIGGFRTPIGVTNGQLKQFLPHQLAARVFDRTITHYNLTAENIDEVILGNAVGVGGNLARQSLLAANWPVTIPGTTIDFQCGGGLKAITTGANLIKSGARDLVIAGGAESTSLEPERRYAPNDPRAKENDEPLPRAPFAPDWLSDPDLGLAAENVATAKNISRSQMDQWALRSHRRATQAQKQGLLTDIIIPLKTKGEQVTNDGGIRQNMSSKLLARLSPVFKEGGTITAGNSCLTNDGAAVVLLASQQAVNRFSLDPKAQLIATEVTGVKPKFAPLSPIPATKKLLAAQNLACSQLEAVEINEAFAVKVLAYLQELNFKSEQINQWGGALAYGHPYGASGAIILLHLLEILNHRSGNYGLATLGAAGGLGIASLVKQIK